MNALPRNAATVLWEIIEANDRLAKLRLVEEFNLRREEEEWENWKAGQRDIIDSLTAILGTKDDPLFEPEFAMNSIRRVVDELKAKVEKHSAAMKRTHAAITARPDSADQRAARVRAQSEWQANPTMSVNAVASIIQNEELPERNVRVITRWIRDLKPKLLL